MPDRLPLLGRPPITFSSAVRKNYNVLNELNYVPEIKKQYADLWAQRELIGALVRHHLRLGDQDACTVLDPRLWIQGAFNVCVLVEVTSGGLTTKLVFRCPKPHRLTGIVDEKLSSEIGAIEEIQGEQYIIYDKIRREFMDVLGKEKHKVTMEHDISVSRIMEEMWDSKGVWFWHCLTSVDAMNFLLEDHLCPPRCLSSEAERAISEVWCEDAGDVVRKKLADKAKYDELLKSRFV
ncbi:hypothetical protein MY11210_009592 [Beauveria gryllotalpidicola]